MNQVEYGPHRETAMITAELDYYKPNMAQVQFEQLAGTEVTFTFKNRGEQRIEDHLSVEQLQDCLDGIRERGFQQDEIDYFASLTRKDGTPRYSQEFLAYIQNEPLPPVTVEHDEAINDLGIHVTGEAAIVTFWETIILGKVNELYFENKVRNEGIDLMELYETGDRLLDEKIATLQANPDIQFCDFGTRLHFSTGWHRHVVQRLQAECPDNLLGTSNVAFANTLGLAPIGTFAHEMPMIYAGVADARGKDIRAAHGKFLHDWKQRHPDLDIALTDTYGSDFFIEDFTQKQTEDWEATRHDSGDPFEYGDKFIAMYEKRAVDPLDKKIVFSDGLDMDTIVKLHNYFKGRINVVFGWGTTLTNDLGLEPLSIVAKATHVKTPEGLEADTVKLSDNPGKHTGPETQIRRYQYAHRPLGTLALAA